MVVDAWIQHPTPQFLAHEMFASLRKWMGITDVPAEFPLEITLAGLSGVDVALISAWWGPQGPLLSNDQVAAWCAQSPKLKGVCSVPLDRPMDAVRELRRCVRDLGFVGLRVLPWLWGLPPDDRRYYPLYAECIELDVTFCLQVGHAGPLRPSEPGRPIPYLDHVACEWPELRIVGGHIGYPWTTEMITLATKYEHVYIDTSAYKPSRYPAELVDYLRRHGRKKVLFGSNHPMIPTPVALGEVDALGLDPDARALFLGGNAARVFRLS